MRVNRFLRDSGLASRRKCEQLVLDGRVTVNGTVVTELGTQVDPDNDRVCLDGKPLKAAAAQRYVLLNKPAGCVVTREDTHGRRIVMDLLPPSMRTLFPVGRLDRDSEGLLLLTDDGELANRLLHPRYHMDKTYLASVRGVPSNRSLAQLRAGVSLDGRTTLPARARMVRRAPGGHAALLEVIISEGRKRQVRRMCEAVGHPVTRLVRTSFAGLTAPGLKAGSWRKLTPEELATLKKRTEAAA